MPDKDNKKLTAEELAAKLEEKAKKLRESGLTPEELEKISGGESAHPMCSPSVYCCGTKCYESSEGSCKCDSSATVCNGTTGDTPSEIICAHSCIYNTAE